MNSLPYATDNFSSAHGDIAITFIGHASLMIKKENRIIHIDPFCRVADYSKLAPADLILITHEHRDHLDLEAIRLIQKSTTTIVLTELCSEQLPGGIVMKNGDNREFGWISIQAVPAYNMVQKRENGQPFHPLGNGNGYVLDLGGICIYIAGDTENIPEMKNLQGIDIAFLPMNLPYTMTPEMVADAALQFKPRILYPYHFGATDPQQLVTLLDGNEIDVRIRNLR